MELQSLTNDHLQDAADLFSTTYQQFRASVPLLPARYAKADPVKAMLWDLLASNPGVVAFSQGRLVGYLAGFLLSDFMGERPGAYCPEWAHAARGPDRMAVYHALLKRLSRQWVAQGCTAHALTTLAQDEELRASLFWHGFGLLAVDALRGLDPVGPGARSTGELRRATEHDWETVFRFERALNDLLGQAPIFRHAGPVRAGDVQQALADANNRFWIVAQDHGPVGYLSARRHNTDACQIVQDEATLSIVGAYVKPELRRGGLGRQLLNAALLWAREEPFVRCTVDFESQNRAASAFWLRYFRPACYTVMRKIDERLVL